MGLVIFLDWIFLVKFCEDEMLDDKEVQVLIKAVEARAITECFHNINQSAINWKGHQGGCLVVGAAGEGWNTQLVILGQN